jgi:hypothetical protein
MEAVFDNDSISLFGQVAGSAPARGQGIQLAARTERAVRDVHAGLLA